MKFYELKRQILQAFAPVSCADVRIYVCFPEYVVHGTPTPGECVPLLPVNLRSNRMIDGLASASAAEAAALPPPPPPPSSTTEFVLMPENTPHIQTQTHVFANRMKVYIFSPIVYLICVTQR